MNTIADNVVNPASDVSVYASIPSGQTSDHATITLTNSYYGATQTNGGPHISIVNGGGLVSTAPIFAPPGPGGPEFFSSPTIGAGQTNATDGSTDLAGNPRTTDGETDIGAYQYQAPSVTASASPASATNDFAFTFTGSASDANPGAPTLSYSWRFDDGTTATGATVMHAFATPGVHTATLTVSDQSPYVATATATVTVTQALARLTDGALALTQPKAAKGKHKAVPFSAQLSFSLDWAATVSGTIERILKGKRVHGRCEAARIAKGGKHAAPCPTSKTVGSFELTGTAGSNTDKLPGVAHLKRGNYEVTLTPSNAGGTSSSVTLDFKVR